MLKKSGILKAQETKSCFFLKAFAYKKALVGTCMRSLAAHRKPNPACKGNQKVKKRRLKKKADSMLLKSSILTSKYYGLLKSKILKAQKP